MAIVFVWRMAARKNLSLEIICSFAPDFWSGAPAVQRGIRPGPRGAHTWFWGEIRLNCEHNMGNKETTKTTKDTDGTEQHKISFSAILSARKQESKEPLEEMSGWLMCDLAAEGMFRHIPQVLDLNPWNSVIHGRDPRLWWTQQWQPFAGNLASLVHRLLLSTLSCLELLQSLKVTRLAKVSAGTPVAGTKWILTHFDTAHEILKCVNSISSDWFYDMDHDSNATCSHWMIFESKEWNAR